MKKKIYAYVKYCFLMAVSGLAIGIISAYWPAVLFREEYPRFPFAISIIWMILIIYANTGRRANNGHDGNKR